MILPRSVRKPLRSMTFLKSTYSILSLQKRQFLRRTKNLPFSTLPSLSFKMGHRFPPHSTVPPKRVHPPLLPERSLSRLRVPGPPPVLERSGPSGPPLRACSVSDRLRFPTDVPANVHPR